MEVSHLVFAKIDGKSGGKFGLKLEDELRELGELVLPKANGF